MKLVTTKDVVNNDERPGISLAPVSLAPEAKTLSIRGAGTWGFKQKITLAAERPSVISQYLAQKMPARKCFLNQRVT